MTHDLPDRLIRPRVLLSGVVLALSAAVAWVALAPPERSLGDGIRIVYLHVSATMAGLALLYGVGFLGAVAAFAPSGTVARRLRSFWVAGLTAFTVGFLLSLVSATVSWGGIFWAEPRVRASLGVVAVGLSALALFGMLSPGRRKRLVWPVAALLQYLVLARAPLYIHPDRPVHSTTPLGIKAAFIGVSALFLAASVCFALWLPVPGEGEQSTQE